MRKAHISITIGKRSIDRFHITHCCAHTNTGEPATAPRATCCLLPWLPSYNSGETGRDRQRYGEDGGFATNAVEKRQKTNGHSCYSCCKCAAAPVLSPWKRCRARPLRSLEVQSGAEWASDGDVSGLALAMCSDLTWLREGKGGLHEEREKVGAEPLIYSRSDHVTARRRNAAISSV